MNHYGDVSALNGAELPPVDIITFGSPCQDMSIAGKRSGLDGFRSSLFYEAVRIIKEMRCATDGKYPRFCVWENVPGAYHVHVMFGGYSLRREITVSSPCCPRRSAQVKNVIFLHNYPSFHSMMPYSSFISSIRSTDSSSRSCVISPDTTASRSAVTASA